MLIDEGTTDPEGRKEIKVKIPTEYQVELHKLKVLTGKNISTAVTEALDEYLERRDLAPDDR